MAAAIALPAGWETGPLVEELKTYQARQTDFLRQSPGKYVLIKGHDVVGFYDQAEEAYRVGYQRFRREAFLVKQVQEQDKTYYIGGSAHIDFSSEDDFASS